MRKQESQRPNELCKRSSLSVWWSSESQLLTRKVSFLLVTAALMSLSIVPRPAMPAEAELPTGEDLVRASRAMQTLQDIYLHLINVMTHMGTVDELAISMIEGQVTREYAMREQRRLLFHAKNQLDQGRKRLKQAKLPKITNETLSASLRDMKRYLDGLPDQIEDMLQVSVEIFQATATESVELLSRLRVRYYNRLTVILESENILARLAQQRVERTHPQYYLTECLRATNESMIEVLKVFLERMDVDSATISTAPRLAVATQALDRALLSVTQGEQKVVEWRRKIAATPFKTQDERAMKATVETMFTGYDESFEIERLMIRTIDELLSQLRYSLDTIDDSDVEAIFTKIELLTDKRIASQSRLLELGGEIGALLPK